ncbi:MAG: flagellar biosynthetic protein FliP, partial [Proteobacteria bacterium]|nr:flagellar biosynthetic protein FliP [Pseudomonadota bacterium]
MRSALKWGLLGAAMLVAGGAWAQAGIPLIQATSNGGDTQYSLTLQLLALMTTLTLLPSLLLMLTTFVRFIIVLSLLRQALGTAQTPPNLVLVGLALFLTLFVMQPVLQDVYTNALLPYMDGTMPFEQALAAAEAPLRAFMLNNTREDDIGLFAGIGGIAQIQSPADVPFTTLVPAYLTSELKSAFTIGF